MIVCALNRNLTAQVLGKARLLLDPADWAQIEEWIASVSPEANAAIARWDSEGKGFTIETVAFDLAHLAARAVAAVRATPGRSNGPVETEAMVDIGDWTVQFTVHQAAKRGDLHLLVEAAEPACRDEMRDYIIEAIRAGAPVYVPSPDGFLNLTEYTRQTLFPSPDDI